MEEFWRHPALPIGVVLLILGAGNWIASSDKVVEYARRAELSVPIEADDSLDEFLMLTPRTNATVLDRLHRRVDYGSADAKRDFYMIVQSGGRFITVAGLLSIGLGLLGRWRRRRLQRSTSLGLGDGPAPGHA